MADCSHPFRMLNSSELAWDNGFNIIFVSLLGPRWYVDIKKADIELISHKIGVRDEMCIEVR